MILKRLFSAENATEPKKADSKRDRNILRRALKLESLEKRDLMAMDVIDINVVPNSSDPVEFFKVGGSEYMVAQASAGPSQKSIGQELIIRVDSPNNPGFIPIFKEVDINPLTWSSPKELTAFGNFVYFSANGTSSLVTGGGREVWRVNLGDVTPFVEIMPGSQGSDPKEFTVVGSTMYFTADSPGSGRELWKTDGTAAGTKMVHNIASPAGVGSNPADLTLFNGKLYFTADDGLKGRELWTTDGTPAGTKIVRDIQFGTGHSNPSELTVAGNKLYFAATNALSGREIWSSDGTTNGTALLKDIATTGSGLNSSNPQQLTAVGDNLYFTAQTFATGRELYRFDPNVFNNVLMVRDVLGGAASSNPTELTAVGQTLYFAAKNSEGVGRLWKTNGIYVGTVAVQGPNPASPINNPHELTNFNGKLYFAGTTLAGTELYTSNGTASGTKIVKDIRLGQASSSPSALTVINDRLSFSADDGINGREHWQVNAAGVASLREDIWVGNGDSEEGKKYQVREGEAYFSAFDGSESHLYKHNPTTDTLTKLTTQDTIVDNIQAVGSTIYFTRRGLGYAAELWKTTGTIATTTFVKSISKAGSVTSIANMQAVGDSLYFTVREQDSSSGAAHYQLWRSIGTSASTLRLAPTINFNYLSQFTTVGTRLYFVETIANGTRQIWKTDGTTATTSLVNDTHNVRQMIAKDNFLYYTSWEDTTRGLYRTNGTVAGTQLIKGQLRVDPTPMVNNNGVLYFAASLSGTIDGMELWKSDGTEAGTSMVKDIYPQENRQPKDSFPKNLTVVSGTILFTAMSPGVGRELWLSDGTNAGTKIVKNIADGIFSSDPTDLVGANGRLYFTALTIESNKPVRKLFQSNGTAGGTVPIQGTTVRYADSPYLLTVLGNSVYFWAAATEGTNRRGIEPMFYTPDAASSARTSSANNSQSSSISPSSIDAVIASGWVFDDLNRIDKRLTKKVVR